MTTKIQKGIFSTGLLMELEAVVLETEKFYANGKLVATVTVAGSPDGPMGHAVSWNPPYAIFKLDADIDVYYTVNKILTEPLRIRFQAELKPIGNGIDRYVVHLINVISFSA